jgi:hypothetical protein
MLLQCCVSSCVHYTKLASTNKSTRKCAFLPKLVTTNAEVTVAKIQQNILQKRLTTSTNSSIIYTC